jgi:hypothetical protein
VNTKSMVARASLMLVAVALSAQSAPAQFVEKKVTGAQYHYQVTDHYCASASIQMVLDCLAVRSTNPFVNQMLNAPQTFASWPLFNPNPPPQPTYTGGPLSNVATNPQVAIYNNIHGRLNATFTPVHGPNTGIPLLYNNPFTPWPVAGSDNNAIAFSLNQFDNPNFGGEGNHAYQANNFASNLAVPNLAAADAASRTIANAIQSYDVPAQATVNYGRHSVAVTGFQTIGTPQRNQPYTILGFHVSDPWVGYIDQEKAAGRPVPQGALLGSTHGFLRYGYKLTNNPAVAPIAVPGVGVVRAIPNDWFKSFTPAPGQIGTVPNAAYGAVNMSFPGYKFVVEPLGPELPDDEAGGTVESFPDFALPLADPVDTPAEALAHAISELSATHLDDEFGLSNGNFDTLDHVTLFDPGGEADWLVPYLRDGEYTGAVLIDSETGILEQATWRDSLDEFDFTLDDLFARYTDYYNGVLPDDNPVPEPTVAVLLATTIWLSVNWRRRRR